MIFVSGNVRICGIIKNLLNVLMTTTSHSFQAVEFKSSTFSVPVLSLASNDLILIEQLLNEKIKLAPEFFINSPVIVDLQEFNKKQLTIEFEKLVKTIRSAGLFVVGLRGGNEQQNKLALELSIPVNHSQPGELKIETKTTKAIKAPTEDSIVSELTTVTITKPIRSGQRVYSHGDLIVLAQVGAGAEILAEGNIHVYGTLRGRALAGVQGNTDARIFCSDLQAELISIAGNYKISDDIHGAVPSTPVQIYLQKNSLVVKPIA